MRFVPLSIKSNTSFAASSLLSDESIQNIIDGLADSTGQSRKKIAFHTNVVLKLTEEQVAQISNKNWFIG